MSNEQREGFDGTTAQEKKFPFSFLSKEKTARKQVLEKNPVMNLRKL